jgi:phosphatidylinositol glycan class C protein
MTKESGNGQESFGSGRKSPWRKLLWVKQPYPDNYVDSSFLSQLKRNSNVRPYNFLALAKDSSVILINLCSVVIFGLVFLGIYNNDWDPIGIAIASTSISVAGYVAREVHANRLRIQSM